MRRLLEVWRCKNRVLGGIAAIVCAAQLSSAAVAQETPIPSDLPIPKGVVITPPGPSTTQQNAGFSGMWVGRWDGARSTALIVTAIKGDDVDAIFCYGDRPKTWASSKSGLESADCTKASGTISDGHMKIRMSSADAIYTMNNDGTLSGSWEFTSTKLRATLQRVQYP